MSITIAGPNPNPNPNPNPEHIRESIPRELAIATPIS